MNEKFLFAASAFLTLAGILALIILSNYIEPELIEINEIDNSFLESFVKVNGVVENFRELESMFILEIRDNSGNIKVIGYGDAYFEKGQKINVIGKIAEYEGELEIEAVKIK